jgi:hypothetical protein
MNRCTAKECRDKDRSRDRARAANSVLFREPQCPFKIRIFSLLSLEDIICRVTVAEWCGARRPTTDANSFR